MGDGQGIPPDVPPGDEPREGVFVGQVTERTAVVVQKTSRFSREFIATMISLASAAFGVVAALAWNTAITSTFSRAFGEETAKPTGAQLRALYIYAVIVTLVGVTVIVLLGRLATRINAQPVEFKYPGTK